MFQINIFHYLKSRRTQQRNIVFIKIHCVVLCGGRERGQRLRWQQYPKLDCCSTVLFSFTVMLPMMIWWGKLSVFCQWLCAMYITRISHSFWTGTQKNDRKVYHFIIIQNSFRDFFFYNKINVKFKLSCCVRSLNIKKELPGKQKNYISASAVGTIMQLQMCVCVCMCVCRCVNSCDCHLYRS